MSDGESPVDDGVLPAIVVPHPDDPRWKFPIHSGYLLKRGRRIHHWARRFMILTRDGQLWYFRNEETPEPQSTRPVFVHRAKFWRSDRIRANSVGILRNWGTKDVFYCASPDPDALSDWMKSFAAVGGLQCENPQLERMDRVLPDLPEISKRDLSRWNAEMVREWLGFMEFGGHEKFSMYQDHLAGLTGADLEALEESELVRREIDNLSHRKKLMQAILTLRSQRRFGYGVHVVMQKLRYLTRAMGLAEPRKMDFVGNALSDPDVLCATYLNHRTRHDSLDSQIGLVSEEMEGEGEEVWKSRYPNPDDESHHIYTIDDPTRLKLPVKLFISEEDPPSTRTMRDLLRPVKYAGLPCCQGEKFGMLSCSLIIGPWCLEWGSSSSLCIPRKILLPFAYLVSDVHTWSLIKFIPFSDIKNKIARVVCEWNLLRSCDEVGGSPMNFVDHVLRAFDIRPIGGESCLGRFAQRLREHVQTPLVFTPSQEFREQFRLDQADFAFDSHSDLDNLVYECGEIDEIALTMDFKSEHHVLRAFDRAFWYRHFKNPEEDKYKPCAKSPFDDPRRRLHVHSYA